ncbi:MAG: carboxypeptidase regulatory-like domain-containing protein [Uliginosibacterium sp.]|nr:carboxypeptidase regulatory-like domain-containing protein [Uliginosibacterium sp.]
MRNYHASGKFNFEALPFAGQHPGLSPPEAINGYDVTTGEVQPGFTYPQVNLGLLLQQSVGGFSGRVIDKATRRPVENAQVKVGALIARTNGSGEFLLTDVPSASHKAEVSASGYSSAETNTLIVSGVVTKAGDIELAALPENPSYGELAGVISDRASNTPIQGASVAVSQTLIASSTDNAGSYLLRDIPLGGHDVRVVAPGYLPTTLRAEILESRRYRLDASLTKISANSVSIDLTTDAQAYGAYSTVKVTTNYNVSSAVNQYGYLEFLVVNSSGLVVKTLPDAASGWTNPVYLTASIKSVLTSFQTDNLPPGNYRIEAHLYDNPGNRERSDRSMLSTSSADFRIEATQRVESINVIPLPAYANYNEPIQAGYRVEVINKSNVDSDFAVNIALTSPTGAIVGAVSQALRVRGDEKVRVFDVPYGSVSFSPHGRYQSSLSVTGISMPITTLGSIDVMPGLRIEVNKKIQPDRIPPGVDHRLKINIRIKGVEQ